MLIVSTITISDDCRQETAAANHTYNGGRRVFGISGSNPEHDVAVCLSLVPESWERVPLRPLKNLFTEQGWGACDQEGCGIVLLPGRSIFCPSAPRVGDVGIIRPHFGVAAMLDVRQCEGGVIVVNASRSNAVLLREGMIVAEEVMFERADEAKIELEALRRDLYETRRVHARISAVADRVRQNLCDAMLKISQERDAARALLARLTPRTYREGDPQPKGTALCWEKGHWRFDLSGWIEPDDIYLDLPPPSEWPQPGTGPDLHVVSDAKDALRQLKRERDEARRDRSDVQDIVDVAAETLKTYIQEGEDIGDAIVRLWNERADLVEACRVHERERASLHARFVQSVQDNGAVADALLSAQRERDKACAEVAQTFSSKSPYAVVVVISVDDRLVVVEYPKRPGCFVLPGGKVEPGESPGAAALREAKEETGRDVLIEAEPFFKGESHNGKPMWAYRGVLNGTVPEEWAGPEGRVRLSSIDEVRRHYHPDFLPAFDRVMGAMWPDVLQKVAQERDALREAHREAQETLRARAADAVRLLIERNKAHIARDRARHWTSLWHRAAKKHRGAAAIERYRADLLRQSLNAIEQERDEARRALNEAGEVLGAVCVASTLAPGESLKDPPRHAAVSAILSVIRERDIARSEAERLLRGDALLVEQERDEARRAGEREALEWALFELDGPGVQVPPDDSPQSRVKARIAALRFEAAKQGYRMGQVAALTGVLLTLGIEQPPCATCDKEEAGMYGGEHACTDPAAIHMEVEARIRDAVDEQVRELDAAKQEAERFAQERDAARAESTRLRDCARWGRRARRAVVAVLDHVGDQMPADTRACVERILSETPDALRAEADDDPPRGKTETLAKRWTNGLEEAFERLKSALESTSGRVELDARTRYALAFLLVEVAAKNCIAGRARGWASLWHDRARAYSAAWKTVEAALDRSWAERNIARDDVERLARERDAARAELDALRADQIKVGRLRDLLSRLAPRTYREGDPRPGGQVAFWYDAKWYPGDGRCLEKGRVYIDLPPPSEWPQPWTGGSGPLDPAQQHAYDALERVTKERDALREELALERRKSREAQGRLAEERDEARQKLATVLEGRDPETGRHDAYLCEKRKRKDAEQERDSAQKERDAARAELDALQHEHRAALGGYRAEVDRLEKAAASLRDELAVERHRYAWAAQDWGVADINALRQERDAARAEVERLEKATADRLTDLIQVQRERDAARRGRAVLEEAVSEAQGQAADAEQRCDRLKAELAALRSHYDEACAELARLREQTTPRFGVPAAHRYCLHWVQRPGEVGDDRTPRWMDAHGSSVQTPRWILPQPPPPPDEVSRLADAMEAGGRGPLTDAERREMQDLRTYVDRCSMGDRPQSPAAAKLRRLVDLEERARTAADAMEADDKPPARGRTEPCPGSQEEPEETRVREAPDWHAAALACNLALVELLGAGSTECGLELHGVAEAIQRKDPAARAKAAVARRLARESGKLSGSWRHLEALCRALGSEE